MELAVVVVLADSGVCRGWGNNKHPRISTIAAPYQSARYIPRGYTLLTDRSNAVQLKGDIRNGHVGNTHLPPQDLEDSTFHPSPSRAAMRFPAPGVADKLEAVSAFSGSSVY
jgi:hypothetical protein